MESKRKSCFDKWQKLNKKHADKRKEVKDPEWQKCRTAIASRDKTCRVWAALNIKQQNYVMDIHKEDYKMLNRLTTAHIKPKSTHPELYYDLSNLVLVSLYFHTLLDQMQHPVTKIPITAEERGDWLVLAKNGKT